MRLTSLLALLTTIAFAVRLPSKEESLLERLVACNNSTLQLLVAKDNASLFLNSAKYKMDVARISNLSLEEMMPLAREYEALTNELEDASLELLIATQKKAQLLREMEKYIRDNCREDDECDVFISRWLEVWNKVIVPGLPPLPKSMDRYIGMHMIARTRDREEADRLAKEEKKRKARAE